VEYFFEAHKLLVGAGDVKIVRELHHETNTTILGVSASWAVM